MKAAVLQIALSLLFVSVSSCRTNQTAPGKRQSPIDIKTRRVKQLPLMAVRPLIIYYNLPDNSSVTVSKDNYTVKFSSEMKQFMLNGGPLGENIYVFDQLHFHWAEDNSEGSEHTVNGKQRSMEAHFVFRKENGSAASNDDEYAVIGVFIQAGGQDNPNFENITQIVNRSSASDEPFTVTAAEAFTWFSRTLPRNSTYYTYPGSLTTPPFSENVVWIVFAYVVSISSQQIEPFRQLTYQGTELTPNFRPTQPLYRRRVFSSDNYRLYPIRR